MQLQKFIKYFIIISFGCWRMRPPVSEVFFFSDAVGWGSIRLLYNMFKGIWLMKSGTADCGAVNLSP